MKILKYEIDVDPVTETDPGDSSALGGRVPAKSFEQVEGFVVMEVEADDDGSTYKDLFPIMVDMANERVKEEEALRSKENPIWSMDKDEDEMAKTGDEVILKTDSSLFVEDSGEKTAEPEFGDWMESHKDLTAEQITEELLKN